MAVPEQLPVWLRPLARALRELSPDWLGFRPRRRTLPGEPRRSAVLILLGESGPAGGPEPDILITERAATLRAHAGQPAFPGGRIDPEDHGPVQAALREAQEETGVDPGSVAVFGRLPEIYLQPSDFMVASVLGWWHTPSPPRIVSPLEVAAVHRVPVAQLADPANRVRVRHPSGYVGPAFHAGGMLVWGFTAGLLDAVLRLGGWERPWDRDRFEDLPEEVSALAVRSSSTRPADQRPFAAGTDADSTGSDPAQSFSAGNGSDRASGLAGCDGE
ncbi:CoA pyrophosphatase [Actinocrinis puniceicyclus]|uniref:CoA pyrophosphatase n=1 Tax=Actinocrinis puniceicyclus TaxID=977794 RepID=A0A8J7WI82_9ACTN|nr:CoA pyrophosphatase [Actinocrinis puniceicyclus]